MRLLILDLVRRSARRALSFGGGLLLLLWMASTIDDPRSVLGLSMGMAFMLGPQTMLWFVPRPIWYLPVSRRDIWRAGWLAATVGTSLWLALPKLAALIVFPSPSYGLATVLLSIVFDFAFAGIGCGLVILATHPRPARSPWRQIAPLWKSLGEIALPAGMLVAFYGIWYPDALPTRWSELTLSSGALLIAALGVTAAAYFYVPSPPDRAGSSLFFTSTLPAPDAHERRAPPQLASRGLTGLPRLLLQEYVFALIIGASIAAASVVLVLVLAGIFQGGEGLTGVLRAQMLLLEGTRTTRESIGLKAVGWLMWYGFFVASLAARFPDVLRHLRVLPVSAHRLNAVLVAWPAVIWASAWAAVLAIRYAVAGEGPQPFHGALFLALCGSSALAQSLTLRFSGRFRIFWFATAAGSVGVLPFLNAPSAAWLAGWGVISLAASAILNAVALGRHATYRARFPPLNA